MLVILPFEKDFYKKWNYEVEYVGHPLVEVVEESRRLTVDGLPLSVNSQQHDELNVAPSLHGQPSTVNRQPTIALLPGSRKQEILIKLPIMLEVSKFFPDLKFVVAQAPSLDDSFMHALTAAYPNVEIVKGKTYELLMMADAALVTSGTATLETALFGIPEVVCYKGSTVSYEIAKRVIKVKYISLVNLIMDKMVVKELIQHELTPENLKNELGLILYNKERRDQMTKDYLQLWEILSKGGHASSKAARSIYQWLISS
jgi:lipid-A-disaccharide synthase